MSSLTHWGRVTHICVGKTTIIGSDNGLSPGRRQAIIWTNAGLLLIGPLGTNFSEILIEILTFSFKKMRLKVSSAKRRPFCLGLNVLRKAGHWPYYFKIFQRECVVVSDINSVWKDTSREITDCSKCLSEWPSWNSKKIKHILLLKVHIGCGEA